MPITYEHRVPASTLGGLALAAGQEQYEAQRGREDRERAMQLAQMAQQQQMQNQRMAYDAASTQYRTMADYNKFVAGAQLDVQQRERDQQNRLALQNNQNQLAAGREEVRWDRAQEAQGQGDASQAWQGFVTEIRGTLNQDGLDILDTHSAKYRSIMANQNFSPPQKAAATSQLLEEVQSKNLGQSYAKELQYEPGKSYVSPKGYKFTVRQDGSHQTLGQNFDDLMKPPEMPDSEWETKGKHVAWLDKHRFGPPGRDADGKQTHSVEGPDGKMTTITVQDEQYQAQVLKEEQIEREKEEREATTERQKNRAAALKDEMSRIDEIEGEISKMVVADEKGVKVAASREQKQAEYDRRKAAAMGLVDELFPLPGDEAARKLEEQTEMLEGRGGVPGAATLGEMLEGKRPLPAAETDPMGRWQDKVSQRQHAFKEREGIASQFSQEAEARRAATKVPADTEEARAEEAMAQYEDPDAKAMALAAGMASEGETKAAFMEQADLFEQVYKQGGKPTSEQHIKLKELTARLKNAEAATEAGKGQAWRNKQRREDALAQGRAEGGTGLGVHGGVDATAGQFKASTMAARLMAEAGIMAGSEEADWVMQHPQDIPWAIDVILRDRELPQEGSLFDRGTSGASEVLPVRPAVGRRN